LHTERWEEQLIEDDHFHDECGVIGVFGHPEAANLTYLGLYALQHRGQESAGIVSEDQGKLFVQRGMGRVADVFGLEQISQLPGEQAIGHVRYSTAGGSVLRNTQPIFINYRHGAFAVGHNGNLVNADELRLRLEQEALFSIRIWTRKSSSTCWRECPETTRNPSRCGTETGFGCLFPGLPDRNPPDRRARPHGFSSPGSRSSD
jgi:Glutamine phosphoribosylpyrophosphate amidotransferase